MEVSTKPKGKSTGTKTAVLIPDLDEELRKFTPLTKNRKVIAIDAVKADAKPPSPSHLDGIEVHPAADLFPMMSEQEFAELKADIEQHGQREMIVYWRGQLLDGRNRLRACRELGIEPSKLELDDTADPVAFVLSANLHRRHLTTAQRAMVAVEVKKLLEPEAKERKKRKAKSVVENLPPQNGNKTRDQAGELLKVSGRSVDKAEKILDSGTPELIQQVKSGEVSLDKAYRAAKKPHVAHNSGDNDWFSPKAYVDAARHVMGGIDLDPCGCVESNRVVEAFHFHTRDNDGLQQAWGGRVWMNPPYSQPLCGKFANKLVEEIKAGSVSQACVLVNNATETKWFQQMAGTATAICFPAGRVRFWHPRKRKNAPLQGQSVIYFGEAVESFASAFAKFGLVYTGRPTGWQTNATPQLQEGGQN